MADIENKDEVETEEVVEETAEKVDDATKHQVEDETHTSELEDEGRKSTLARIAEILTGKKRAPVEDDEEATEPVEDTHKVSEDKPESEDVEGEETEEDQSDTDEYEEIDPRFVAAARSYGWSDDRIVEYSENHDDRDLVQLTSMMESNKAQTSDVKPEPVKEPSDVQKALNQLETNEDIGEPVKQLLKSLITDLQSTKAQLKAVTDTQKDVDQTSKQQEWVGRAREADDRFDAAAKEFAELGSFSSLKRLPDGSLNPNDPAVKIREELFKVSVSLFTSGYSWENAVKHALQWYKGGREDVVEGKILQKIKSNAKRLSPKRETRHQTRKFANEIEEKGAVVNEALSKYGIELPE